MEEISRSLSFICESRSNSYLFRRLQSWHFVGVFSVLVQRHFKSHARKKTKGVYILNEQYLTRHHHERRRMSSRRKNPHPKRAVNARTVLKVKEEQPPVLCSRIPDEDDDLEANHHQIQKEETTFIENKRGREAERLSREAGLPEDSDRELSPPPPPEGKTRKSKRIVEKIQKGIIYDKYKHLHSPILSPGRRRNNGKKGVKRKRGHECDVCEKVFDIHPIWPDTCVLTRKRNRTNVMCARSVLRRDLSRFEKPRALFTRTRNRTNVMFARSAFVNLVL